VLLLKDVEQVCTLSRSSSILLLISSAEKYVFAVSAELLGMLEILSLGLQKLESYLESRSLRMDDAEEY
jgi:hypothetical protein